MEVGRRGFVGMLGLGAAAAPAVGKQLLAEGAVGPLGSGMLTARIGDYANKTVNPSPIWEARGISEMLWKAWHQEAQAARERMEKYAQTSINGLDPIAAVSRSWSPAFRVSFTYNKMAAMSADVNEKDRRLWDNPS